MEVHDIVAGFLANNMVTADTLPDLTVTEVKVNQQCKLMVTIKNLGPGSLPETAFYVGTQPSLQMYKNNSAAGAVKLNNRSLQPAGGTYTHTFQASNQLVSGTHSYRAKVDKANIVTEANENNNERTSSLSCTPSLPDLAVTKISFNKDCSARVTLRNIGTLNVSDNKFNTVNVSRRIDGANKGYMQLRDIDPTGKLKAPGGEVVWADLPSFKATATAKYTFSGNGMIGDGTASNNTLTANIPSEGCGATHKNMGTKRIGVPQRVDPRLIRKPLKKRK